MSVAQPFIATNASVAPLAQLNFDQDGFLLHMDCWNEAVAESIATAEGVTSLQAAHWRVLHFVRDRFLRLGAIPPMRHICRSSQLSAVEAKRLFGGCRQVWRIAGLPNPGEEAKSYMG